MNCLTVVALIVAGSFALVAPALSEPSKADQAKQAEQAKKAEEAKKAEAAKKAEEAKKAEAAKKVEEAKKAEAAKKAEEAKKGEQAKKSEQERNGRELANRSFAEMKGRIDNFMREWRRELENLSHDASKDLSQPSQQLWNKLVHPKGAPCVNRDDVVKIADYVRASAAGQHIVANNPQADTVAILTLDVLVTCESNVLVGDFVFTVTSPKLAKEEQAKKAEAPKKEEQAKKEEEAKKARHEEFLKATNERLKKEIDSFTGQWRRGLEDLSHDTSSNELSQRSQKLWDKLVHLRGAPCVNHDDVLKIAGYLRDSAEGQRIVMNNPKVDTVAILQLDVMLACENNFLVGDLVFTVRWPKVTVH